MTVVKFTCSPKRTVDFYVLVNIKGAVNSEVINSWHRQCIQLENSVKTFKVQKPPLFPSHFLILIRVLISDQVISNSTDRNRLSEHEEFHISFSIWIKKLHII